MQQGEVYWLQFEGHGSEPLGRRPAVVVQHDRYNMSAMRTTVVAAITSNLRLAAKPGNVRLSKGEANLQKLSVVNVTQLVTVDRSHLQERIGTLRPQRLTEVRRGLALVFGIEGIAGDDD